MVQLSLPIDLVEPPHPFVGVVTPTRVGRSGETRTEPSRNRTEPNRNRSEPEPNRNRTEPELDRTRTGPSRTEPKPNQTRTKPVPVRRWFSGSVPVRFGREFWFCLVGSSSVRFWFGSSSVRFRFGQECYTMTYFDVKSPNLRSKPISKRILLSKIRNY